MGWIKGPGGSMKWVSGGGGWNTATGESTPVKSNITTNPDGTQTRTNRSSGHQMPQERFVENTSGVDPGGTGLVTTNESSGGISGIDTSQINFDDPEQVKEIQMAIGATVDGQWGPETERLYREQIDLRRKSKGQESYKYGSPTEAEGNPAVKNIDAIIPTETGNGIPEEMPFDFSADSTGYGGQGTVIGGDAEEENEGWGSWLWDKLGY